MRLPNQSTSVVYTVSAKSNVASFGEATIQPSGWLHLLKILESNRFPFYPARPPFFVSLGNTRAGNPIVMPDEIIYGCGSCPDGSVMLCSPGDPVGYCP